MKDGKINTNKLNINKFVYFFVFFLFVLLSWTIIYRFLAIYKVNDITFSEFIENRNIKIYNYDSNGVLYLAREAYYSDRWNMNKLIMYDNGNISRVSEYDYKYDGDISFKSVYEAASCGAGLSSSWIKSPKWLSSSSPIGVSNDTGS